MLNRILFLVALVLSVCLTGCAQKESPKVASTVVASPVVVPVQPVTFNLNVGLLRKSGEVFPVARQDFIFSSYSQTAIRAKLAARPGIPPEPHNPMPEMQKCLECSITCYQNGRMYDLRHVDIKNCVKGCGDCDDTDKVSANAAKFLADRAAWEKVAYAGEEEATRQEESGKPLSGIKEKVTTDLTGVAKVTLKPGTWYVSGQVDTGNALVTWQDVPVHVVAGMDKFELSNDNGSVLNR